MSLEINRVLVPTDFSDYSREAVDYAIEIAFKFGASLTFLHVLQDAVALFPEPGIAFPAPGNYLQGLQESAMASLEELKSKLPAGLEVDTEIRSGTPFVEIVRYAKEKPFDLIVLGTHGRAGLAHVLMGSVAEKVVQKASCPVLTVRPKNHRFEMP